MKLPQQQEIIYMDGLGKLSVGSRNYLKPVVKPNKDVTIKVAKKYELATDDKQFEKGRKICKRFLPYTWGL